MRQVERVLVLVLLCFFPVSSFGSTQKDRFFFDPAVGGRGDATHYGDDATGGTCSYGQIKMKYFAAFPGEVWDKGRHCGRCIEARGPKGMVKVMVTNKCPECLPGRQHFEWNWTTCDESIQGRIGSGNPEYAWKEGSSGYWFGIQPRNFGREISAVSLDGIKLERTDFNFFIHQVTNNRPLNVKAPHTVVVTFGDGSTVTDQVYINSGGSSTGDIRPGNDALSNYGGSLLLSLILALLTTYMC